MPLNNEVIHRTSFQKPLDGHTAKSSKLETLSNVNKLASFVDWATYDLPPRTKTLKLSFYANLHKSTMVLYMLGLMIYFNNFSLGCWVYAALHGSYGLLWNLKTMAFPDATHQKRISIGSLLPLFSVLSFYWYIPYLMASGQSEQNPSSERIFWSIIIYVIGACFMMISDAQKYFCLKFKKGLIDYGMFAFSRNPNYLGEMTLYGSFALLSNRWIPWIILISIWSTVFAVMMVIKEMSFRRKDGWEQYKRRSYILLPKIYGSHLWSLLVYGTALVIGIYCYNEGGLYKVFV